jgi:hypothetical protein
MKSRATFEQIRVAVAPQSIQVLEHKARTASGLAVTYPANAEAFRAIESVVLLQLFRIMAGRAEADLDVGIDVGGIPSLVRFQSHTSVVIPKQEKV